MFFFIQVKKLFKIGKYLVPENMWEMGIYALTWSVNQCKLTESNFVVQPTTTILSYRIGTQMGTGFYKNSHCNLVMK